MKLMVFNGISRVKFLKIFFYVIIFFSIKYSDIKGYYLLFRKMIMMCVYLSDLLRVSVIC